MKRIFNKDSLKRTAAAFFCILLLCLVFIIAHIDSGQYRINGKAELSVPGDSGRIELISSGRTEWKYLDDGQENIVESGDELRWRENKYDASGWKEAAGSFGAKDGERKEMGKGNAPNILLEQYDDDGNSKPVYLFRTELTIANPDSIAVMTGEVEFDDAVLIYINGELAWAGNNPDGGYKKLTDYGAKEGVSSPRLEKFTVKDTSMLKKWKNTVAVEVHQNYASGSDIYFNFISLEGLTKGEETVKPDTSGLLLEVGEDERSIRVNWYTDDAGAYELQYSIKQQDEEPAAYAGCLMGRQKGEAKDAYCYTAEIDMLETGREYVYRIRRLGSQDISETYTFCAPGKDEDFTFLFAGDPQIGAGKLTVDGKAWENSLNEGLAAAPDAAFLITAGDQADSSDPEKAKQEYLEFRRSEILKSLPTAVNPGNHEAANNLYEKQFQRDGRNDLAYSFTYKNVLFVALDLFNDDAKGQADFLRRAIEDHPSDWVVVTMHYSLFSAGAHADDESIIKKRNQLAPVFSECNVDLVLAGHDHSYSRTFYMNGLTSTGKTGGRKKNGEVLYLTGGSSTGNKYYEKNKEETGYDAFFLEEKVPVMVSVTVKRKSIEIRTYDVSGGEEIDACIMTK